MEINNYSQLSALLSDHFGNNRLVSQSNTVSKTFDHFFLHQGWSLKRELMVLLFSHTSVVFHTNPCNFNLPQSLQFPYTFPIPYITSMFL